ncbi:UNVERIFIED_CONTAM: hypothetical protein FKN15_068642 [Acipenser sinensis]
MAAMQSQTEACLRVLCQFGVDLNAEVASDSWHTALHLAVGILASYGADTNAVDRFGMTPLHMAAGILNREMTDRLVRFGANVNTSIPHNLKSTALLIKLLTLTYPLKNTNNEGLLPCSIPTARIRKASCYTSPSSPWTCRISAGLKSASVMGRSTRTS